MKIWSGKYTKYLPLQIFVLESFKIFCPLFWSKFITLMWIPFDRFLGLTLWEENFVVFLWKKRNYLSRQKLNLTLQKILLKSHVHITFQIQKLIQKFKGFANSIPFPVFQSWDLTLRFPFFCATYSQGSL